MPFYVCAERKEAIKLDALRPGAAFLLAAAVNDFKPQEGPWAGLPVATFASIPPGYICIDSWLHARLRELGWLATSSELWWDIQGSTEGLNEVLGEQEAASFEELLTLFGIDGDDSLSFTIIQLAHRLSTTVPPRGLKDVRLKENVLTLEHDTGTATVTFPVKVAEVARVL